MILNSVQFPPLTSLNKQDMDLPMDPEIELLRGARLEKKMEFELTLSDCRRNTSAALELQNRALVAYSCL